MLPLLQDATFDMERRRNRPEKYDRALVHKTVNAMKKITDVRQKRQDRCGPPACSLACLLAGELGRQQWVFACVGPQERVHARAEHTLGM